MKKHYFNIFRKVKLFFSFIVSVAAVVSIDVLDKKTVSFVSLFFYVFFLVGGIALLYEKNYYYGDEIIDTPKFFRKRIRKFSQIIAIEKGYDRTVYIHFLPNKTMKPIYSGKTVIEYAFQKKELIEMIKKIVLYNPNVKFIKNKVIVLREDFIKEL
ncbi:hypothetical protein [Treponema zioleckii]|uniref:hypothetical protein n=1 Tax=Treponema zioleckii TaxID=331680 RepID=UPI00168B7D17|nr:hypothetical protein [Treponema zioleckii]